MRLLFFILLSVCVYGDVAAQYNISTTQIDSNIYLYTSYGDYGDYKNIDANAVVVVSGDNAFIFDTPWDETQAEQLITWVEDSLRKTITGCIITHAHADRIGSIATFHKRNIPTYCYTRTVAEAKRNNYPIPTHIIHSTDTTFHFNNIDIVAYYPGEGHTVDNIVLYMPSKHFLYGGCFIKSGASKSIGNIADANVAAWPISINAMQKRFSKQGINMVIPGHGPWNVTEDAIRNTLLLLKNLKE